ncbi:MAG: glycosyltransferase family 4 protein [Planctomycetes bacterium]|nr:glycosyltransferase family 4 protein [Planctomycetota bacterium]
MANLRVTIDGTDFLYGERAVRRHVVNLLDRVGTFGEPIDYRLFLNEFRPAAHAEELRERPGVQVRRLRCPRRVFDWLNTRAALLPVDLWTGAADIYHSPGSTLFRARARHYLYTVGGLAVFVRPDVLDPGFAARAQRFLRRAFRRVTHFLAVSETTRKELLEHFALAPEQVTAIPLGVDSIFRPEEPERAARRLAQRFPIRRPYLLYVGGIQRNKNLTGLLEAFDRLAKTALSAHQLVLVGPRAWPYPEFDRALAAWQGTGRVLVTGPLAGADLAAAYAGADLFVFPTFYEGWTSPPLEAMASGVPVVTSGVSSVPETVGNAAVLVDPCDSGAIAAGIREIVESPERRSQLVALGSDRAAQFTWDRCIRRTVDLYLRLAKNGASPERAIDSRP